MNRQIYFLLLFVLTFCSTSCSKNETVAPTIAVELFKNGNLEGGIQNWLPGLDALNPTNPNGFTTSLSQEFAASPVNSIKINFDKVVSTNAFCFYTQFFPITSLKIGSN